MRRRPNCNQLRPTDFVMDRCLEDADDLAIDVVDGGGEEKEGADDPAKMGTDERGFSPLTRIEPVPRSSSHPTSIDDQHVAVHVVTRA